MLRGLTGWHLVIIIALLVILFGFKRLPDAARSLGRSMRVFKSEVDEMKNESRSEAADATVAGETVAEGSQAPVDANSSSPDGPGSAGGPLSEGSPRTDNRS